MPVWFDVGAHKGESTLKYARKDPTLVVYAFEPNPANVSALFGVLPNYHIIPAAVGLSPGVSVLHMTNWDECHSLLPIDTAVLREWNLPGLVQTRDVVVSVVRLDDTMRTLGIQFIDFLKIDAQGSDLDVIISAGCRLSDIKRIQLEVPVSKSCYRGGHTKKQVLEFLLSCGYDLIETKAQANEENLTFER